MVMKAGELKKPVSAGKLQKVVVRPSAVKTPRTQ